MSIRESSFRESSVSEPTIRESSFREPHARTRTEARPAPGPVGEDLARRVALYESDPLGQSLSLFRDFGDIVALRRGPFVTIFLFHPQHARRVLVSHMSQYSRRTRAASQLKASIGNGLVTADKPEWTRQKKLTQPGFTKKVLDGWTPQINAVARQTIERWQAVQGREPIDVHHEFGRALLDIVSQMLIGQSFSAEEAKGVREAFELTASFDQGTPRREMLERSDEGASAHANRLYKERYRHFLSAQERLNEILHKQISQRREKPPANDFLSALMTSTDEAGEGFSDQEVRDQLKTMVAAGHDTTMSALSFTLLALSTQPDAYQKVRAEVERVCGTRDADAADLDRLEYLGAVVDESLRLFPPVAHIDRRAEQDDVIDGILIPRGVAVALAPYVVHRRADLWEDPESFRPERFSGKPPAHYFPFSLGPRVCIGKALALMEIKIFVAHIVRLFDLAPVEDFELSLACKMTVHPRGGRLPLWVKPR